MADTTANDPSMEEILASIRRILAAEDERDSGRSLKPDPGDVTDVTDAPPDSALRAPVIEATMATKSKQSWMTAGRAAESRPAARTPYVLGDDASDSAMRGASWLETDENAARGGPAQWNLSRGASASDAAPVAEADAAPEDDLNAALRRIQSEMTQTDDLGTQDSGVDDSRAGDSGANAAPPIGAARLGPVELNDAASQAQVDDHAFVAGLGAEDLDDAVRRAQIRAAAAPSDEGFYADSDDPDDDLMELTHSLNDDGTVTPLHGEDNAAQLRGSLHTMVRSAMERDQARRSAAGAFTPDPIASATTEKRVVAAFAGVTTGDAPRAYGGLPISDEPGSPTVEELTQRLLKPMLREWIDANLPAMVERIVREEIERMAARARRMRRAMEDDS